MQLDDRFSVTRTLNRMGLIQLSAGNLADSLQLYQRSLSLASDLTVAAPQNVTYRRGFAVAALKIGDVVDRMHDYQRAFDAYSQSEHLLRQLSQENPASADLRRTFAFALGRLAIGHLKLHRSAEAVAANRETLAVYQTLAKADPDNSQTQIELADTYANLGDALGAEGDNSAGADAIRQGLSIYARNPGYTAGRGSFATLYLTLGNVLMKTDAVGALDAYRKASALFAVEPVRSEDPSRLAESYAGMGDAYAKLAAAAPQALVRRSGRRHGIGTRRAWRSGQSCETGRGWHPIRRIARHNSKRGSRSPTNSEARVQREGRMHGIYEKNASQPARIHQGLAGSAAVVSALLTKPGSGAAASPKIGRRQPRQDQNAPKIRFAAISINHNTSTVRSTPCCAVAASWSRSTRRSRTSPMRS